MEGSVEEPGRRYREAAKAANVGREEITGEAPGRESERVIVCAEQRIAQEG